MKMKTGDTVKVLAGKDKGKEGKVTQVFPALGMIVVDGINVATKHLKKRGKTPGQKMTYNAPFRASKVALVGPKGPGRVGFTHIEKDGKRVKVRVVRSKKGVTEIG